MQTKEQHLFIYGTLAPGRVNHHIMQPISGTWKKAFLRGDLHAEGWGATMGYPAIIPSKDADEVEGIVFSSAHLVDHWERLDEFEGDAYQRMLVDVRLESDEQLEAYVYALKQK